VHGVPRQAHPDGVPFRERGASAGLPPLRQRSCAPSSASTSRCPSTPAASACSRETCSRKRRTVASPWSAWTSTAARATSTVGRVVDGEDRDDPASLDEDGFAAHPGMQYMATAGPTRHARDRKQGAGVPGGASPGACGARRRASQRKPRAVFSCASPRRTSMSTTGRASMTSNVRQRRPREHDDFQDGGEPAFDRARTPQPPVDSASHGEAEPRPARAPRTR